MYVGLLFNTCSGCSVAVQWLCPQVGHTRRTLSCRGAKIEKANSHWHKLPWRRLNNHCLCRYRCCHQECLDALAAFFAFCCRLHFLLRVVVIFAMFCWADCFTAFIVYAFDGIFCTLIPRRRVLWSLLVVRRNKATALYWADVFVLAWFSFRLCLLCVFFLSLRRRTFPDLNFEWDEFSVQTIDSKASDFVIPHRQHIFNIQSIVFVVFTLLPYYFRHLLPAHLPLV